MHPQKSDLAFKIYHLWRAGYLAGGLHPPVPLSTALDFED